MSFLLFIDECTVSGQTREVSWILDNVLSYNSREVLRSQLPYSNNSRRKNLFRAPYVQTELNNLILNYDIKLVFDERHKLQALTNSVNEEVNITNYLKKKHQLKNNSFDKIILELLSRRALNASNPAYRRHRNSPSTLTKTALIKELYYLEKSYPPPPSPSPPPSNGGGVIPGGGKYIPSGGRLPPSSSSSSSKYIPSGGVYISGSGDTDKYTDEDTGCLLEIIKLPFVIAYETIAITFKAIGFILTTIIAIPTILSSFVETVIAFVVGAYGLIFIIIGTLLVIRLIFTSIFWEFLLQLNYFIL